MVDLAPSAVMAIDFARAEAAGMNHGYVGTEHILLGLMRQADTHTAQVLAAHLPDLGTIRQAILHLKGRGHVATTGDISFTTRAKDVLEFAQQEADLYQARQVEPEHLLIGILREGEGSAMRVMLDLGVKDFGRLIADAARDFPALLTDPWIIPGQGEQGDGGCRRG